MLKYNFRHGNKKICYLLLRVKFFFKQKLTVNEAQINF